MKAVAVAQVRPAMKALPRSASSRRRTSAIENSPLGLRRASQNRQPAVTAVRTTVATAALAAPRLYPSQATYHPANTSRGTLLPALRKDNVRSSLRTAGTTLGFTCESIVEAEDASGLQSMCCDRRASGAA